MQKASIGKILLALVISCVYIYLFGIVQVVHVSADNEREIEVSIPEVTTSAETEKTPETTTIKLQDDKKPTLVVYRRDACRGAISACSKLPQLR